MYFDYSWNQNLGVETGSLELHHFSKFDKWRTSECSFYKYFNEKLFKNCIKIRRCLESDFPVQFLEFTLTDNLISKVLIIFEPYVHISIHCAL